MGLIPSLKGRNMIPLILAFGGALAALSAVSTAAGALAAAIPIGLFKKNKESERNARLGIDTEYMKSKTEEAALRLKNGQFAQPPRYEDFEEFELADLPAKMSFLSRKWLLTKSEMTLLLTMVRKQMQLLGEGSFANETEALCKKYNIPWDEMVAHSHELAVSINYEKLMWLSDNRTSDFFIQQKLKEQKSMENG